DDGAYRSGALIPKGGQRMITLTHFLVVSACIFCIGLYAVLAKRNSIMILVGIELMINAAILNFVAFGKYDKLQYGGQVFALFAIVLAAAAVAVGLAIILNVYRHYKTINPQKINELKDQFGFLDAHIAHLCQHACRAIAFFGFPYTGYLREEIYFGQY